MLLYPERKKMQEEIVKTQNKWNGAVKKTFFRL